MEIDEAKLREILTEQRQEMQRYIGMLKEDSDSKMQTVLEYVKDIRGMKVDVALLKEDMASVKSDVGMLKTVTTDLSRTVKEMKPVLDATFEKVGMLSENVTVLKQTVQKHDVQLRG